MWSRTPCAEPKSSTWRRWLTLSGPIEPLPRCFRYHATLSARRREEGDAGARVGDLGRRREHDRPVRVPGRRGEGEDVGGLRLVLGQVVQGVGVVPEDLEVGCGGRHGGEARGDVLAADRAGRVGVRRHHPHALDGRVVGDQRRDGVGVGPVVVHGHGHHLDAQALEQGEVTVVARHRAHEAHLLLTAPRPLGVDAAEEQEVDQAVAHDRQARVAAGHDLIGLDPEQLGEDLAQLAQALEAAVVADVDARGVLRRRRQPQQGVREVELLRGRLATGQVELQPPGLEVLVGGALLLAARRRGRRRTGRPAQSRSPGQGYRAPGPAPAVVPTDRDGARDWPSSRSGRGRGVRPSRSCVRRGRRLRQRRRLLGRPAG